MQGSHLPTVGRPEQPPKCGPVLPSSLVAFPRRHYYPQEAWERSSALSGPWLYPRRPYKKVVAFYPLLPLVSVLVGLSVELMRD